MFPEDGISRFSTGNNTQSLAFTNGYPDASLGLASFFEINQAKQGITYTRDGKPALYYSPCMYAPISLVDLSKNGTVDICSLCNLERRLAVDAPTNVLMNI